MNNKGQSQHKLNSMVMIRQEQCTMSAVALLAYIWETSGGQVSRELTSCSGNSVGGAAVHDVVQHRSTWLLARSCSSSECSI